MSVAEFYAMTSDETVIHLLAKTADQTMGRLALDLLAGSKPTVTELRTKFKET